MPTNLLLGKTIRIGSRASALARRQAQEVLDLLAAKKVRFKYEFSWYQTSGDLDKQTPLMLNPAGDFFTDTIDVDLLKKKIDLAIHSAKDLPQPLPTGLSIFALTPCLDETDSFVGHKRISQLPPGSRVGASSLNRKEALLQLNPKIQPVDIRGTIAERLALIDKGKLDGLIVASCALQRLGWENRITEIMPWETTPLQGQLAIVGREDGRLLRSEMARVDVRRSYGRVTLVGAGPGDPQLITLKGVEALKKANCVFYDYLIDKALLKHAPQAEKIYVGKRKGSESLPQNELSRMLRHKAVQGRQVVRLKGGDPLIFGRGADEIAYLKAYHIEVNVIPGVTSATGIPSGLGIPLTARGFSSSVAFVSGHAKEESASRTQPIKIPKADTLVFLMGLTKLPLIVHSLQKQGWSKDTPCLVVSKGTTKAQKLAAGALKDIENLVNAAGLEPPALIVVGQTVRFFRAGLTKDSQPGNHSGTHSPDHHILYLGTHPEKYRSLGRILHFPMIEIRGIKFTRKFRQTIFKDLDDCDLVILTSPHAVQYFFAFLKSHEYPVARLQQIDFVVVGYETKAALRQEGIEPKLVAEKETSEGLFAELDRGYNLQGKRILLPRSALPNPFLKEHLRQKGARVHEFAIYRNIKTKRKNLPRARIDSVFFSSPSTVRNFLEDFKAIPDQWQILSKGTTTQRALLEAGYESEIVVG